MTCFYFSNKLLCIKLSISPSTRYTMPMFTIKQSNYILDVFRQFLYAKVVQSIRHLVIISTCYGSSYGSHSVCISTQRDAQAQCIFIILAIEEGNDGFWYGALTTAIKSVCRTYVIATSVKVIAECFADKATYFILSATCPCHKNSSSCGLCSLDTFGMVVCHFGRLTMLLSLPGYQMQSRLQTHALQNRSPMSCRAWECLSATIVRTYCHMLP